MVFMTATSRPQSSVPTIPAEIRLVTGRQWNELVSSIEGSTMGTSQLRSAWVLLVAPQHDPETNPALSISMSPRDAGLWPESESE